MLRMVSAQKAAATNVARVHTMDLENSKKKGAPRQKSTKERSTVTGSTVIGGDSRKSQWVESELNAEPEDQTERRFNIFMSVVILSNVFVMAIEIDATHGEDGKDRRLGWVILDSLFIMIFLFEIAIRLYWERQDWVRSAWNWFDLSIVAFAVVDVWVLTLLQANVEEMRVFIIFRIFRLLRLVRLVKLVRVLEGLYVMLMASWYALQSMFFLLCIMVFGIMIYGIVATMMIGRNDSFRDVRIKGDTVDDRFGTVTRSMYSLFELMTLEGFEDVARPLVTAQPLTFVFIVSFIMIFTFGLLNMTVALVIEKTMEQIRLAKEHKEHVHRKQMVEQLCRLQSDFSAHDIDDDDRISVEEWDSAVQASDALKNFLGRINIKPHQARDVFAVLDNDNSGSLTATEFSDGLKRVQGDCATTWDMLATKATVSQLKGTVTHLYDKVDSLESRLESRLAKQDEALQTILGMLNSRSARKEELL